jgi:hypothetical protein
MIVFRGQVEIGAAEGPTGNLIMTENEVVLRAPKDGGPLQGTMLLQWDDFAIGQFASGLAEGIAEGLFTTSSPAQRTEEEAILATCESDIRISGTFEGVFDAGISKLSGTVTYTTDFLSNMRCARPLTAGMKEKVAAARISTSATWEALYDGVRNASGKMDPPASISFRLAVDP